MSIDYNEISQSALDQIREVGQPVVISRPAYDFDPVTSEVSNSTSTQQTLYGIAISAKSAQRLLQQAFDGAYVNDLVTGKVRGLLLAAKGNSFDPMPSDMVTLESKSWQVIGVSVVSPAGVPLLYRLLIALTGEIIGEVVGDDSGWSSGFSSAFG